MMSAIVKLDKYLIIFVLVSAVTFFGYGLSNQVCEENLSSKGRHFIVTVPPFPTDSDFNLSISIASSSNGYAVVRLNNGSTSLQIGNYSLLTGEADFQYMRGHQIRQYDVGKQTRCLEISSSVDVSVHITGYASNAAASFLAFPVDVLSNEYSIPSYENKAGYGYNYVQITSPYNSSFIVVNNYTSPQSSLNATISKFDSYTLNTKTDPKQAYVVSSSPINVVVGNMCTKVPKTSNFYCDTLYDSPIPVKYWGTAFVVPPLIPKSGYSIRLYSKTDNNTGANVQYLYNNTYRTLHIKDMDELLMGTEPTVLLSDKPINVIQYGFTEFDDAGEAFMNSVPAINHFSNDYVFGTPFADQGFTYRLTITIGQGHYGGLLLNNRNITEYPFEGKWSPGSLFNNFDIITLKIKPGSHVLKHKSTNVKFGALLYGLKQWYGFAHNLGLSFSIANNVTCYNGGSCLNGGRCVCLNGYTGQQCERSLDVCASRPCLHGGICRANNDYFSCSCNSDWTGQYCESALVAPINHELTCFDCDYTTSPSYCDSIQTCASNQKCFLKKTTDTHGHVHFTSGCTDEQVCSNYDHIHSHTSNDVCLQCCNDSFCNSRGCGDTGFPPKEKRGPICLDCSFASHPQACDKVTICAGDEFCHIEELPWGANSIYHLGCKPKNECALWSGQGADQSDILEFGVDRQNCVDGKDCHGNERARKLRSTPICKTCCTGDFCNRNCTVHNGNQQIIVG